MKTKEKLSFRIYVAKHPRVGSKGGVYPLTEDGSAIDLDNEMSGFDLPKYKFIGENNQFNIYELKKQYC